MPCDSPTFLSSPSAIHTGNLPHLLSEILEVDLGLLVLITCLLPWLTNKAAVPDSDDEDPQGNDRTVSKKLASTNILTFKFCF